MMNVLQTTVRQNVLLLRVDNLTLKERVQYIIVCIFQVPLGGGGCNPSVGDGSDVHVTLTLCDDGRGLFCLS